MIQKFKTSDGIEYQVDEIGVIHQLNPKPFNYTPQYSETYDTEEYKRGSELLNNMRVAFLLGALGEFESVLDFGYGNGDFLRAVKKHGIEAEGYDITGVNVKGIKTWVNELPPLDNYYEVVCFWDALEHLVSPATILMNRGLIDEHVAISLPCLPFGDEELEDGSFIEKFDTWKHRKPHEHLHHFTIGTLISFMRKMGYELNAMAHFEDIVRRDDRYKPNIISAVFQRKF